MAQLFTKNPVVETNHVAAVRKGEYTCQYPAKGQVELMNGMLVVIDFAKKEIKKPATGLEFCSMVVSEEQIYEGHLGRNGFSTKSPKLPKVCGLTKGDIFETNALDMGTFTTVDLAKTGAKFAIPTASGYAKLIDAAAGATALTANATVLQLIEWVKLPNGEQGVKFLVAKSKP